MKIIESDKLRALSIINPVWVTQNERDEAGVVTPPPITPPPIEPPPVIPPPPVTGEQGSKTNPFKMNVPYSKVQNGFVAERKGYSFSVGASKVYVEVDPSLIKTGAKSFRLYVKPMNCPTLSVYRAFFDKTTNVVTDDVKIGTMDTVSSTPARPFASTKFIYCIENTGEAWTIEAWVQVG